MMAAENENREKGTALRNALMKRYFGNDFGRKPSIIGEEKPSKDSTAIAAHGPGGEYKPNPTLGLNG